MIIEDYYGFNREKSNPVQLFKQKSSNRPQKQSRINAFTRKSPMRTLKRTELSNDKLNSRDSKKARKVEPPRLQNFQSSNQQSSNARKTILQQDGVSSNQQQIQLMVKKYDNYKNTDSYEFKQGQMNNYSKPSYPSSSENNDQYNQRGYRFEKQIQKRRNRFQHEQKEHYYDRNYHSAIRDKNGSFLVHFQREAPMVNAIERYTQNHSASNDIRAKKSRSLGAALKPYKMHTFYNAQRMQYFQYNEEGYLTDRQHQLLNKIQEKALRAFQRAANRYSQHSQSRRPLPKILNDTSSKRQKPFELIQSSELQHRNSNFLKSLESEEYAGQAMKTISSRDQNKIKKNEKFVELSIKPRKSNKEYSYNNDYQMSVSSKNKASQSHDESLGMDDSNISPKQLQKDMFRHFAKQDSSLLKWSPKKDKQQQQQPKQQNLQIPLPNQHQDSARKSSEISNDYKSIDMVEINSNYKPSGKQIKQRNEFIGDNRSDEQSSSRQQKQQQQQQSYPQSYEQLSEEQQKK